MQARLDGLYSWYRIPAFVHAVDFTSILEFCGRRRQRRSSPAATIGRYSIVTGLFLRFGDYEPDPYEPQQTCFERGFDGHHLVFIDLIRPCSDLRHRSKKCIANRDVHTIVEKQGFGCTGTSDNGRFAICFHIDRRNFKLRSVGQTDALGASFETRLGGQYTSPWIFLTSSGFQEVECRMSGNGINGRSRTRERLGKLLREATLATAEPAIT